MSLDHGWLCVMMSAKLGFLRISALDHMPHRLLNKWPLFDIFFVFGVAI